ncbi:MAG: ankyrin repeat domain-containing protein [Phycisphaerales bacterium]
MLQLHDYNDSSCACWSTSQAIPSAACVLCKNEKYILNCLILDTNIPIEYAATIIQSTDVSRALSGPGKLVLELLSDDVEFGGYGVSKLCRAIDIGIDIDTPFRDQQITMLMKAAYSSKALLDKLLSLGANPNARSKNGWTALMFAVSLDERCGDTVPEQDAIDIVHALVLHGADREVANSSSETALDIVCSQRFASKWCIDEIAQLIRTGHE